MLTSEYCKLLKIPEILEVLNSQRVGLDGLLDES